VVENPTAKKRAEEKLTAEKRMADSAGSVATASQQRRFVIP